MKRYFVILAHADDWRIGIVDIDKARVEALALSAKAEPTEVFAALKPRLEQAGYQGEPLLLALGASWCLCARLQPDTPRRQIQRQSLDYLLEEHLPASAEDFTADYVNAGDGTLLGVCAERHRLDLLVNAARAAGIEIAYISPVSLLATAYALSQQPEITTLLWADPADSSSSSVSSESCCDINLVQLHRGHPTHWWWLADDLQAAREHLSRLVEESTARVSLGIPSHGVEKLKATVPSTIQQKVALPWTSDEAATLEAARVLKGVKSPWIDLRCESLAPRDFVTIHRKPLTVFAAALVLLAVTITAAALWHGHQYSQQHEAQLNAQTAVFRSVFPEQRLPGSIRARLTSERQKLTGMIAASSQHAPESASALTHLHALISHLPSDTRWRILDMSIQSNMIRIEGETLGHADAERIAAGLRQAGTYQVEAPKTQALRDGGVSFVLVISLPRVQAAALSGANP